MKKNFPISDKGLKSIRHLAIPLVLISLCFSAHRAQATVELDRQYALETIGFLQSTDNVDGLFTDYVSNAYKDYFSKQSRFVVEDLSKVDTTLTHSKIPYYQLIQDKQVLAQIARTTRSQTILRTKVLKEGSQYRFTIEWLHAPQMFPLATTEMILKQPPEGFSLGVNDVQTQIESALDVLVKKIPWVGHITGRDGSQVTLNIGSNAGLHKGDTLIISSLDDVKRHPLLNTIVEWKLTRTGTVEIDSADESISFGHVTEEEEGRHVLRYQKVTQIIPTADESHFQVVNEKAERTRAFQESPRLGFVTGTLWGPGGYSRDYGAASSANSRTGGGLFLGAKIDGQLWLTHEILAELGFGYGFWSYSQNPPNGGSSTLSGSSNVFDFKLAGGYSYLITDDVLGPKADVKLGYRSDSYSLPESTTESIGPVSFKTVYLGLGGELPIRNHWGVNLDFGLGIINTVSQTGAFTDGSVSSSSNVSFSLGTFYRMTNRMTFRASLEALAQSATFSDQASVSQKIITFSPAVLFYF